MKTLTLFLFILTLVVTNQTVGASPDITGTLAIVKPNGSELLATGDSTTIEWAGVQPQDTVLLEYSTDNGISWTLITDMATGLQYRWAIPALSSNNCLMRVVQLQYRQPIQTLVHKRPVTDLVFTADGTQMITSASDGGVVMWNSNNGTQRYVINSANARFVSISPTGKYFSVSNLANDGSIWDVTTGLNRNNGFAFTPVLGRIAFLNNDTIALPISNAVFTCRYKVPSGFSSDNYPNLQHGRTVNDTRFNALKTRLIAGSNDSMAIVWNFNNRAKIAQLPHQSAVWTVDISSDASRALTDDKAGNVFYWNALNSNLIAQLGDKNFTSSRLSPDGKHALGGGRTQTRFVNGQNENYADGVVWDLTSHNPVRYLRGHTMEIVSVCYSFDGKLMATASKDSTVKIWDLSETQSATSALPWNIIQPALTTADIDMRKHYVGEQKDSIILNLLNNQSNADVRIQSIRLTGGDSSKFTIKNANVLQILPQGNSQNIEISFIPDAERVFSTTLEIITQNQVIRREVKGEGVQRLAQWLDSIDLGQVYVGDSRDSTIQVVLTNVSSVPLALTTSLQNANSDISIIGGGGTITIAAGQPHTVTLIFAPKTQGIITSIMQIEFNGYGAPVVIPIKGEGICTRGNETIAAGSAEAVSGQTITIPVVISFPSNTIKSSSRLYTFDVRFNKTALLPTDNSQFGIISGGDRIIHISGQQNGNDTLAKFILTAGTGTAETIPIAVENFEWTDCRTGADAINGKVLLSVCKEGSPRLYNPDGKAASLAVLPNSIGSEDAHIKFRIADIGNVEISIMNVVGNTIPIFSGMMGIGEYTLPLHVQLTSGVYFVRMTTLSQTLVERIEVE
ncbi:MAG: choice-of-anchor D domain-containing protein [Ignavibacteriae bacterium]|nr:choice-of-anchor D domain-containing protein [Ignavibacteriota bacterium]